MAIKRVYLDESKDECISCGNCEAICPEVFEVPEKMVIRTGADYVSNEDSIREAVEACPTSVIGIE